MKVIDLLNRIANGEEAPLIKYRDKILHWNKVKDRFEDKDGMNTLYETDFSELNDEVEIIEEDKKIEKYDTGLTNGRYTENSIKTGLDTDITIENIIINMGIEITLVKEKMFEIIDKINSMEVK